MTATKTSARNRLDGLEEAVRDAERRLDQLRQGQRKAAGELRTAEGQRLALEEQRGAGKSVSDKEMTEAVKATADAREVADVAVWRAREGGATRAIEEAKLERDEFGRRHFAEIAAEEVALDGPARDSLQEAWDALQKAAGAYARRTRRWHQLSRYGGISSDQIPTGTPLQGELDDVARRFESGLEAPTPRTLRVGSR